MVQHNISCTATDVATSSEFTCVGRVHDGNSLAKLKPSNTGLTAIKLHSKNSALPRIQTHKETCL